MKTIQKSLETEQGSFYMIGYSSDPNRRPGTANPFPEEEEEEIIPADPEWDDNEYAPYPDEDDDEQESEDPEGPVTEILKN